ncbi:hypothetical protein [Albidovulum sp.]
MGMARERQRDTLAGRDALEYWYLQETTPVGTDALADLPAHAGDNEEAGAISGWWIVPALLLAIPAWIGLFWSLLGG